MGLSPEQKNAISVEHKKLMGAFSEYKKNSDTFDGCISLLIALECATTVTGELLILLSKELVGKNTIENHTSWNFLTYMNLMFQAYRTRNDLLEIQESLIGKDIIQLAEEVFFTGLVSNLSFN